ncbi:hypothetical protein IAT38_002469 [Cryptococcus sp. DSM 104549]
MSSAAASSDAATSAAASSVAASSAADSSAAATSSAAETSAAASSAAASSGSTSAAESSAAASDSSSAASSLSSTTSSAAAASTTSSAAIVNSTDASTSSSGISGGAIGGIVGGILGGLILAALLWTWVRKRKGRGEKMPPPPKREVSYQPPMRQRQPSNMNMSSMGGHHRRTSTYSSLLAPPRASSTFNSHSRQHSYSTYPAMSPSSHNHDASPPMPPSSSNSSADSPSLSTGGATTPANYPPNHYDPNGKPVLTPIDTHIAGSDESEGIQPRPVRVSSVDKLRAQAITNGQDRAQSPASIAPGGPDASTGTSELHTPRDSPRNSPRASLNGFPSPGRGSGGGSGSPMSGSMPRTHRHMSMNSLGSSRYLHFGPSGGAPHQGRPMQIELPKLLGARPDANGDFFNSVGVQRVQEGQGLGLDELGRIRRPSRAYTEQDYAPSPTRSTFPSSGKQPQRPEVTPSDLEEGRGAPQEGVADPRTVLGRESPPNPTA